MANGYERIVHVVNVDENAADDLGVVADGLVLEERVRCDRLR